MAIKSFGDSATKTFYLTGRLKKGIAWTSVRHIALRKLDMLSYALTINDLKSPPANRLEQLKGSLKGFYSIRINKQWRIIFEWKNSEAESVKILDYH